MTVIEDEQAQDRYGNYGLIFKGAKSIKEIYEWLFHHYQGFKFCIVIDVEGDEWYDFGKGGIFVNFLHDVAADELRAEHYYICTKDKDGNLVEVKQM